MSGFFDEDGLITDAERANTLEHAARSAAKNMDAVKVTTASIPIIRQQTANED